MDMSRHNPEQMTLSSEKDSASVTTPAHTWSLACPTIPRVSELSAYLALVRPIHVELTEANLALHQEMLSKDISHQSLVAIAGIHMQYRLRALTKMHEQALSQIKRQFTSVASSGLQNCDLHLGLENPPPSS